MKRKNKVYITNDPGHDFQRAEVYGELIVMTRGEIDKFNITEMIRTFDKYLKDSEPSDYIIHVGPAVMNAIACSYFAAKHGNLNLLIWRAEADGSDRYITRRLRFERR